MINTAYITATILTISKKGIIGLITTFLLYISNLWLLIEPYFFGRQFVTILTILLMSDMIIGVMKHHRLKDFKWKTMFNKLAFKLLIVAIASASSKSIVDIYSNAGESTFLISSIKMTIALYLFGNIQKNICSMTDNQLCFNFLYDKLKLLLTLFKRK
jgi:hypothetical protein